MKRRQWILLPAFALVAFLGYWLAGTAAPKPAPAAAKPTEPPPRQVVPDEPMPKFRRAERLPSKKGDIDALAAGALPNQRVLVFSDQDALARFLEKAGNRINLLGRLDALNALRIGFSDFDDYSSLLTGEEEESLIYPVSAPAPPEGTVQPGALALGDRLLDWLGVSGDNSNWGAGVKIAILDTGVVSHPAFNSSISAINLVNPPADSSLQNGHGTAVASVIIGNDPLTPGIAPGADILSIRIADDNGQSDSFLLAKGIVAAVDGGAKLINISMGSFGDSALVRNAIAYARATGALIIAASGNNGLDQVAYPAANEGVIAVGAVDAMGDHLDFSNSGDSVAISAPGYGVNAAWTNGEVVSVTGTSFPSPIVAGAIAAVMTQAGGKITANQAWSLLSSYLNDGGAAGKDTRLGAGMPDISRVLNAGKRGIYDAAIASHRILPPDAGNPYGQVEILVQNRGTENLINTAVNVSSGGNNVSTNITSLAPNAVRVVKVPISRPPSSGNKNFSVSSRVSLSGGARDIKPSNDRRNESYVASGTR
jgi:Subtilase family